MTKKRSLVLLVLLVVVAVGWWQRGRGAGGRDDDASARRGEDPSLLLDRLWVDSKPEKYTDYMHALITLGDVPIGIFQKASSYQATIEVYEYKRSGNRLAVHFPQTGKKRQVQYRIRRCDDLSPFDLCLDLSENPWGGPKRYYGMSDPDQEAALLGSARHHLEHHLADAPRPPAK